jgi:hypothetical protein
MTTMRTVDQGGLEVQENKSWERIKIHTVPLGRYITIGSEDMQKL